MGWIIRRGPSNPRRTEAKAHRSGQGDELDGKILPGENLAWDPLRAAAAVSVGAKSVGASHDQNLVTSNVYDELNRPTFRTYNDSSYTPNVIYCYDGKSYIGGSCTTTANTNSYTNYTHDDQGRILTSTQRVDVDRLFTYQYYADDTQAMASIPGPRNRVTCYDQLGRPTWVRACHKTIDSV